MIGYLEGKIKLTMADTLVVLASGVGYEVSVPSVLLTTVKVEEEVNLFIHTHVREDQISLFGFKDLDELSFFKMLLSVSGIGPKVALAIISSAPVDRLKESIATGDSSLISAVSGVGKKTAEKTIIELRNKLGDLSQLSSGHKRGETEDICSALIGLGFRKEEIIDGIKKLPKEIKDGDDKIKWLLKNLGRN